MKLSKVNLSRARYIGAINATVESLSPSIHGVEMEYDPRTMLVTVYKGDRISLVREWATADVSDEQEGDDAGAESLPERAPGRGARPKKQPTPVPG